MISLRRHPVSIRSRIAARACTGASPAQCEAVEPGKRSVLYGTGSRERLLAGKETADLILAHRVTVAARPERLVILVEAPVSSTKTSFSGSKAGCVSSQARLRRKHVRALLLAGVRFF